ncbi:MAG: hypothetical protein MI922_26185, partial [Bacteroidales bacterium]|nr:hypothetical protein [Bacteroidales bacterium]
MDNEIKGTGNSINYKYRMHDPMIGRFFAVDPLTAKYPHYTPYSFSGNIVINAIELEGLEPYYVSFANGYLTYKSRKGELTPEDWKFAHELRKAESFGGIVGALVVYDAVVTIGANDGSYFMNGTRDFLNQFYVKAISDDYNGDLYLAFANVDLANSYFKAIFST